MHYLFADPRFTGHAAEATRAMSERPVHQADCERLTLLCSGDVNGNCELSAFGTLPVRAECDLASRRACVGVQRTMTAFLSWAITNIRQWALVSSHYRSDGLR